MRPDRPVALSELGRWSPLGLTGVAVGIVLAGLVFAAALGEWRMLPSGAVWLLGCLVPGYLLVIVLSPADLKPAEHLVFALGGGYGLLILLALLLQALPGPLTRSLVVGGYLLLVLAVGGLALWQRRRAREIAPQDTVPKRNMEERAALLRHDLIATGLILILALILRFPYLGYAEFQGDEAKVMLRAAAINQGREDALLLHKKGPAEILIPAVVYAIQGSVDESTARLPFTIAGLAGLVTLYCLGRRMFGWSVGLLAALLVAVNGYFVGFSRIIQYQSLVFLFVGLAVLAFIRFHDAEGEGSDGGSEQTDRVSTRPRSAASTTDLALGLGFFGLGLIAHYEAVLSGLVPLYLVGRTVRWRIASLRPYVTPKVLAGGLVVAIAAAFYVMLALHPYFGSTTVEYLSRRRGQDGFLYNHLGYFLSTSTFYNSTYYILLMIVSLGGVALWVLRGLRGRAGTLAPAFFLVGVVAAVAWPQAWQIDSLSLAVILFVALFVALVASRRNTVEMRVLWLWFFPGFLLLTFGVKHPWTHFYMLFPAWALLSAFALDGVWQRASQAGRAGRWAAVAAFAVLFALSGYYLYLVFVQHDFEYKRTYPVHKPSIYWTVYGDVLPDRLASFGFPYRAGWKTIGALFADGILAGDYDSNEEVEITQWYTRGAVRCKRDPRYYFVAENVQDPVEIPDDRIPANYDLIGDVQVGEETKLRIYGRKPEGSAAESSPAAVETYAAADYAARFDGLASPAFPVGLPISPAFNAQHQLDARLGDRVRLIGYDLDRTAIRRGEALSLTLYWQALQPIETDYNVFSHVESDRIWGQRDGVPVCRSRPTSTWKPGEVIEDSMSIVIGPDTPAGRYPLVVGLYDWATGARLDVVDAGGNLAGNQVELAQIEVAP